MIEEKNLLKWQKEAYDKWKENNNQGIVCAATGSGKTRFALFCMQSLRVSTIILVPSIALMKQWKNSISRNLDIDKDKVGIYYSAKKEFKPITIAVVNSVRLEDLSRFKMVVADELHRYGSKENIKPISNNDFKYKLGITATIHREDGNHELLKDFFGDIIYRYDQEDAIKDKTLCEFDVINIAVDLLEGEQEIYNNSDETIKELMPIFNYNIGEIFSPGFSPQKTKIRKAITQRRHVVCNAKNKVEKAIELIKEYEHERVIIFCEYIDTATKIRCKLYDHNIKGGIYHSGIPKGKREEILEDFRNGKCTVLITVKALDEGLNVPRCAVAIIVANSKSARQIIQRVGRILRKKDYAAKVFQLYCKGTKDEQWLHERMKWLKSCRSVKYL